MNHYLAIIYFCLISLTTVAQTDKERLRSLIADEEKVATIKRINHSGIYQLTPSQNVPSWLITPPVSEGNTVYSIGISDPELDSIQAFKMALYRAEVLANVLFNSTTQLLCDFFLDEQQHASNIVYENYSRIYAFIAPNIDPYEIINTHYNAYNEAMVLIKYNTSEHKNKPGKNKIELEVYKNETESSIYGNYESVFEMKIKHDSLSSDAFMFYQLTELDNRNSILTKFDSTANEIPIYTFAYLNFPSTDSLQTQSFSQGLWKEFYKSFTSQIVRAARTKPENVSVLSNKYQTTSYQKLTQGISQNRMRFILTGITAKNNQLSINLKEIPLLSE